MLSVFPQLLYYYDYAPLILRLTSALVLLYVAYQMVFTSRYKIGIILNGFRITKLHGFLTTLSVLGIIIISGLLVVGLFTQVAAIVAIMAGLKLLFFKIKFDQDFGLDIPALLLFIILNLVLITIAPGVWALDLPL